MKLATIEITASGNFGGMFCDAIGAVQIKGSEADIRSPIGKQLALRWHLTSFSPELVAVPRKAFSYSPWIAVRVDRDPAAFMLNGNGYAVRCVLDLQVGGRLTLTASGLVNGMELAAQATGRIVHLDDLPEEPPAPERPGSLDDYPASVRFVTGGGIGSAAALDASASLSAPARKGSSVSWSGSVPASWPMKTVKKTVNAIICLFHEEGGTWVGGKFDWLKPGQKSKGLENLHDPSYKAVAPRAGSRWAMMAVSVDGKLRSPFAIAKERW